MIKTRLIQQKEDWERFVLKYPGSNFLHSWNWGEMQSSLGKKVFRFGFFKQSKLQGTCFLIRQEAKRGYYLECPGGPLIDWTKLIYFEKFIDLVKRIGWQENCVFIRLRPQLLENLANRLLFKNKGFIPAPMHLHAEQTLQLDLEKTEEKLLREMRKTTRYLIKKALIEKDLKVEKSLQLKDVDLLYQLQKETAKRNHFIPFPLEFFKAEFKTFLKDDQIRLFKAVYQEKVLSIALIIFYGKEAVYHYSGSSSSNRKVPSSYLLQWEAIKEAKKRKCKVYNLWGVAPLDDSKHRFAGVGLFKRGFGGKEVNYLHAHDLPLQPKYWLVYIFEQLRRILRRL